MEQFSAQLGVITNTLEGLQQGIFTLTVSIVENDGMDPESSHGLDTTL